MKSDKFYDAEHVNFFQKKVKHALYTKIDGRNQFIYLIIELKYTGPEKIRLVSKGVFRFFLSHINSNIKFNYERKFYFFHRFSKFDTSI